MPNIPQVVEPPDYDNGDLYRIMIDNDDDDHNEDILKNQSFAVSVDFETNDKEENLIFNEYLMLAPLSQHIYIYMGQLINERSSRVFI